MKLLQFDLYPEMNVLMGFKEKKNRSRNCKKNQRSQFLIIILGSWDAAEIIFQNFFQVFSDARKYFSLCKVTA